MIFRRILKICAFAQYEVCHVRMCFVFTLRLLHIYEWTNKSLEEGWLHISHRMVEVGIKKSSSLPPLLKQIHLEPVA